MSDASMAVVVWLFLGGVVLLSLFCAANGGGGGGGNRRGFGRERKSIIDVIEHGNTVLMCFDDGSRRQINAPVDAYLTGFTARTVTFRSRGCSFVYGVDGSRRQIF